MAKIGRKLLWIPVLGAAAVFGQPPTPDFIISPTGLSPVSMDVLFRVQGPLGSPIDINLHGPATIWISQDGAIFFQTEMVQMSLAGPGALLGSALLSAGDGVANGLRDGPLYSQGGVRRNMCQ